MSGNNNSFQDLGENSILLDKSYLKQSNEMEKLQQSINDIQKERESLKTLLDQTQ
jgi:uncharacterized protein YlxW (UPF0749 family)